MAFVNDFLKEEERREYTLGWPYSGKIVRFGVGVIDRERDIRLFQYANGPIMEPSDIYSFIFDYKGKVIDIDLQMVFDENDGNTVYWYLNSKLNIPESIEEEQLNVIQALREAIEAYGISGMARTEKEIEYKKREKSYAKF